MVKFISHVIFSVLISATFAEEITPSEKEVLLGKLNSLKGQAESNNRKTQSTALSAFREAMSSDTAAYNLYIKCHERKLLVEDRKKASDAREQKNKIKEALTSADKRALRYQLSWLVSSIEAATDEDARGQSAKELESLIVNIVKDVDKLNAKALKTLKSDPYSSIFAKTYNISHLKPEAWPSSPLDYEGLYWGLLCEPLVEGGFYDSARSKWDTRISAEKAVITKFAKKPDSNREGNTPVELEKFISEKVPVLKWKIEQLLYDAGDERKALGNAYKVIENYPNHKQNLNWIEWLTTQLNSDESEEN